jgi:hypothetical protein
VTNCVAVVDFPLPTPEPAPARFDIDEWDNAIRSSQLLPASRGVVQNIVYAPKPLKYKHCPRTIAEARSAGGSTRFEQPVPSTLRDMRACLAPHKVLPEEYGATPEREFGLCGFVFRTKFQCPFGDECELRHEWFTMEEGLWAKGEGAVRCIREMAAYFKQNEFMEV